MIHAKMHKTSELVGAMGALAHIKPPARSFSDWRRFLDEAREAGVAALDGNEQFATPLGFALLRRWRWLEDAERRGLRYEEAETAFAAAIERDSAALKEAMKQADRQRARAMSERDGKKPKPTRNGAIFDQEYDDESAGIFEHARSLGL